MSHGCSCCGGLSQGELSLRWACRPGGTCSGILSVLSQLCMETEDGLPPRLCSTSSHHPEAVFLCQSPLDPYSWNAISLALVPSPVMHRDEPRSARKVPRCAQPALSLLHRRAAEHSHLSSLSPNSSSPLEAIHSPPPKSQTAGSSRSSGKRESSSLVPSPQPSGSLLCSAKVSVSLKVISQLPFLVTSASYDILSITASQCM